MPLTARVYRHEWPELWLLRTNKAIHSETSAIFYGQNRFRLDSADSDNIGAFLAKIGLNSASHLHHLCIDFPQLYFAEAGDDVREQDILRPFGIVQNTCPHLKTVTTIHDGTWLWELDLDDSDDPASVDDAIITGAIEQVDDFFRSVSSLQEILVEEEDEIPCMHLRNQIERLGWTIKATASHHARECC